MKKMNSVRVLFADSKYNYNTNVSAESTEQTAKEYFVGKTFDLGNYPKEDYQKCIGLEFTDNNLPVYETGATSHAVNDLILFSDNTRELAEMKETIYRNNQKYGIVYPVMFSLYLHACIAQYEREFPTSSTHITGMTTIERGEFMDLCAAGFEEWVYEQSLNA